ncbi:Zn(II)2Cys6 transcription factor [Candidatus Bathyarchaeota archaeon]|nr:Zn(II)2Cys6 transcription factor [Candidatus Bathyarchaeota archaeon]
MAPPPHTHLDPSSHTPQKKKCDEVRPQCNRCSDKRLDCVYEAVKPRQRRRQSSRDPLSPVSPLSHSPPLDLNFTPYDDALGAWDDETRANIAANTVAVVPEPAHIPPLLEELAPVTADLETQETRETHDDPEDKADEETDADTTATANTTATSLAILATANNLTISIPSPAADPPHINFLTPLYADFAGLHRRRTLVDHFCNVLSRLIVLNEDSGNPFQRLVLPMCQRSEAVRNAVYALASAHREYRGLVTAGDGEDSAFFYNQAIQGITMLIEKGAKSCRNELLAAIMLLVYYEVVSLVCAWACVWLLCWDEANWYLRRLADWCLAGERWGWVDEYRGRPPEGRHVRHQHHQRGPR